MMCLPIVFFVLNFSFFACRFVNIKEKLKRFIIIRKTKKPIENREFPDVCLKKIDQKSGLRRELVTNFLINSKTLSLFNKEMDLSSLLLTTSTYKTEKLSGSQRLG